MKKVLSILAIAALGLMANEAPAPDFKGFLGVQSCVQNGLFTDCDLKKYHEGEAVVAVIDGKTYQIDRQDVSKTKFDHAIMRNDVKFYGKIEGDVLKLTNLNYIAGKREFSKGCM